MYIYILVTVCKYTHVEREGERERARESLPDHWQKGDRGDDDDYFSWLLLLLLPLFRRL